jgi:trk system potassium uptake protein TrkA
MRKRVAVIGLGTFGQEVARQLMKVRCEVIAIDVEKDLVQEVSDDVTRSAAADVRDRDAMRELGVGQCDAAILSLRGHIDTSVLAILVLQELGVREIIAQAISEDHRRVLVRLGATRVIFPDKDMAERTAQMIVSPELIDYVTLAPGYGVSEIEVPPPLIGQTILQADVRKQFAVNIAAIRGRIASNQAKETPAAEAETGKGQGEKKPGAGHPSETPAAKDLPEGKRASPPVEQDAKKSAGQPFVPTPSYTFKAGDILICLGRTEDLRRFAEHGREK